MPRAVVLKSSQGVPSTRTPLTLTPATLAEGSRSIGLADDEVASKWPNFNKKTANSCGSLLTA